MTDPAQTPVEPYIRTQNRPRIERASYFEDKTRGKIGHIRKVLEDIAGHIGEYYVKRISASFPDIDMTDVEVYLPLIQNLKIESSRNKMTAMLLANAMRSKEFPLSPAIIRSSYQLPVVFTAFVTTSNVKADDIPYLYEMMSTLSIVMRVYDGTQLGVMRVNVMNSQISRNPLAMEAYSAIIQFNMNINGVIDYSIGRDGEVEFSVGQVDLFKNIRRPLVSSGFSSAGQGAVSSASGGTAPRGLVTIPTARAFGQAVKSSATKSAVIPVTLKEKTFTPVVSRSEIITSMVNESSNKPLFIPEQESVVQIIDVIRFDSYGIILKSPEKIVRSVINISLVTIGYSDTTEDSQSAGITITDIVPYGTLNTVQHINSEGKGVTSWSKTLDNPRSLVTSEIYRNISVNDSGIPATSTRISLVDSTDLFNITAFISDLSSSVASLYGLSGVENGSVTSNSVALSSGKGDTPYYIIDVTSDSIRGDDSSVGDTRIYIYGNDGSIKNLSRFIKLEE